MKINMYGGALTISYNLAKLLRREGQDVRLFVDRKPLYEAYSPEWEDEELKNGYPDWITVTDAKLNMIFSCGKESKQFAVQLSDCDILHLHAEAYLWALVLKKDFIYHSHGYDLDRMPYAKNSIKAMVLAYLCRRAIKKSKKIIIAPHQKVYLERLKIADRGMYLPFPINTDKYARKGTDDLRRGILSKYNAEFIFFHPSRHEWMGNCLPNKGNDKAINAFASYLKNAPAKAVLILINKGQDIEDSRKMIDRLGIAKNIMWLDSMPKDRLIEYYNASDIILDQFAVGSFGQIFVEAMACGKPTFIYLEGYENEYAEPPPAINVKEIDDITKGLIDLTGHPDRLKNTGDRSRDWAIKYHGKDAISRYMKLYKSFLEK